MAVESSAAAACRPVEWQGRHVHMCAAACWLCWSGGKQVYNRSNSSLPGSPPTRLPAVNSGTKPHTCSGKRTALPGSGIGWPARSCGRRQGQPRPAGAPPRVRRLRCPDPQTTADGGQDYSRSTLHVGLEWVARRWGGHAVALQRSSCFKRLIDAAPRQRLLPHAGRSAAPTSFPITKSEPSRSWLKSSQPQSSPTW